jgi:hypothetical protein
MLGAAKLVGQVAFRPAVIVPVPDVLPPGSVTHPELSSALRPLAIGVVGKAFEGFD